MSRVTQPSPDAFFSSRLFLESLPAHRHADSGYHPSDLEYSKAWRASIRSTINSCMASA